MYLNIQKSQIGKRELVFVALFYLAVTIGFLWFAVRPNELSSRLQTIDSVLMAIISDHVAQSPFQSEIRFWNFGIFYPISETLCLSDPMITSAVLTAPVIWLSNWVVAYNLWIYICWWGLAMTTWWYLRWRGCDSIAALWAGLFISFSPDRSWHLAGHGHLFYQCGLFLALIGMERALTDGRNRWKVLYALGVISQIFAGIYLAVITVAWAAMTFPLIAISKLRSNNNLRLWRNWSFLWIAPAVGLFLFLPIAKTYSDFGKQRGQNTLEQLIVPSATPAGYLLPPAEPARLMTPLGKLIVDRIGSDSSGEDSQYLGLPAMFLLATGLAISLGSMKRWNSRQIVFVGSITAAGLVCLFLSFGPSWNHAQVPSRWMPFSKVYDWFESIRFFRAPSRFAFGVQWSVGILGALALTAIGRILRDGGLTPAARIIGILCLIVTLIDFYPRADLLRYDVKKSPLSDWLNSNPEPYVVLPVDSTAYLIQYGWNHVPVANGYSGYAPENRLQELSTFEQHFPGEAAIALLKKWGITRVLIQPGMANKAESAIASGKWKSLRSGAEGAILEYTGVAPTLSQYKETISLNQLTTASLWKKPIQIIENSKVSAITLSDAGAIMQVWGMQPVPNSGWNTITPPASIAVLMTKEPLSPVNYSSIKMRYRISNWYDLRENAALYWTTVDSNSFDEKKKVETVLNGDGQWHDITISLNDKIAWFSSTPVRSLRLDLSYRLETQIEVESLKLE